MQQEGGCCVYLAPNVHTWVQCRGAGEERPRAYIKYDEDVPQPSNPAVRQEPAGVPGYARQQGWRCGHLVQKTQYVVLLLLSPTPFMINLVTKI